jgi:hypothetical protein
MSAPTVRFPSLVRCQPLPWMAMWARDHLDGFPVRFAPDVARRYGRNYPPPVPARPVRLPR